VPGLGAPVVRHDFAGGYVRAVEWLAARGHRRIGALLPRDMARWSELTVGWSAAFERLGLEPQPDLVRHIGPSPTTEDTHQIVSELLTRSDPPTALFAATAVSTLVALRAIQTATQPSIRNVALVGTGDRRWELLFPPTVPFVCLDSFGLGTTAANILNDLIDGGRDVQSDAEIPIAVDFVDTAFAEGICP
jgi:LacI family transcriptional regulator